MVSFLLPNVGIFAGVSGNENPESAKQQMTVNKYRQYQ